MTQPEFSSEEMIMCMARLGDLERAGSRIMLHVGPFTAMTLIGAMQLVMRHPEVSANTKMALRGLIEMMRPMFREPAAQQIIDMGYNPEHDG